MKVGEEGVVVMGIKVWREIGIWEIIGVGFVL